MSEFIDPTNPVEPQAEDPQKKELRTRLHKNIESCKQYRRQLIRDWQTNVDYRRGKPFPSQSDEDRIAVNLDWPSTDEKQSMLFSKVPAVRISHPPQTLAPEATPWLHSYELKVNDTALQAGAYAAMEELLPDCINAAGIGVCLVSHEALTEMVPVPAIDLSMLPPELQMLISQTGTLPDGSPVPMTEVPRVIDARYRIARISPADFLWPLDFTGSDFDNAPWVGRSGRITWAQAVQRFGLDESEKSRVLGESRQTLDRIDRISYEIERDNSENENTVSFDEIFYRHEAYDPNARSYTSIQHVVFVAGREKPVIDEQWRGQQFMEDGTLVGAQKYPIRVLTLSYVTDDPIPPSDSAIGRPQVDELNLGRTQQNLQRQHSLPIRGFNVDRVDPVIQHSLMRGTWQGMIPVQGNVSDIIGEVSGARMPAENFMFDRIAKSDYVEAIGVGPGMYQDVETKAETQARSATAAGRIGHKRAKVGAFYVGITEVLGGLISIIEDPESIGEGFSPMISKALAYSILADSTVLLDAQARLNQLIQFVNFSAKSGYLNVEAVLKEIAVLSGLPASVIQAPTPRPPEPVNMSLRLTGIEDLLNPMAVAMLKENGQAPTMKSIEEAKQLIAASVVPPMPTPEQLGMINSLGIMPPPPGTEIPQTERPPLAVGDANPQWAAMNRINARTLERERAAPRED